MPKVGLDQKYFEELPAEMRSGLFSDSRETDCDFHLEYLEGAWQLRALRHRWKPLHLDFTDKAWKQRIKSTKPSQDPLLKAVGRERGLRVLDICAGLGEDAAILSSFGAQVTSLERSPVLYLLLSNALKRAALPVNLIWTDAQDYFTTVGPQSFDVCYVDPMFPASEKTALPSRPMQFLRDLLSADEAGAEQLIRRALDVPIPRVVVKRPHRAPAVQKPTLSIRGKTIRFDVYLKDK